MSRPCAASFGELVSRSVDSTHRGAKWLVGSAVVLALLGQAGCKKSGEGDDDRRAAQVLVGRYEAALAATLAERDVALEWLAASPCTDASMCADRDSCVSFLRALATASSAAASAKALASSSARRSVLGPAVVVADRAVEQAEIAERRCKEALGRLYPRSR